MNHRRTALALPVPRLRSHWRAAPPRRCNPPSRSPANSHRRPARRRSPSSRGGTASATPCCRSWCAAPRARTATSRWPPSACMPRARARPSAARRCCPPSACPRWASTATPAAARPSRSDRRTCAAAASAWMCRGRSTSRAGCAPALRPRAAEALAAEYGTRGVRMLVVSDVATNYFTLVGAQRQLETVRAIAAAHDETLRLVQARAARGAGNAVRRGPRADRGAAGGCGDPAARNAGGGVAPSHRRAHRRPGVQCGEHRAVEGRCRPCRRRAPASRPRCSSAGPTCWRSRRSWKPRISAASRPPPNGSRACSWAPCSAATAWS